MSFSYDDWKSGQTGAPIRGRKVWEGNPARLPVPDHEYYSVSLQDNFRKQGLQVLVSIGSIELTPDQPCYSDNWHTDSLLNEHVVAMAIYYYDDENVTKTKISFRQRAHIDEMDYNYDRTSGLPYSEYEPNVSELAAMLGFDQRDFDGAPTVQTLGSISAPQGRLITWSNTLQYRVEPFTLVDATVPGHRRFVMLSLVDPHYRICSTRNVPPQRQDWVGELLPSDRVQQEARDNVVGGKNLWPVSMDDAREAKTEMARERTWAGRALGLLEEVFFIYY